MYVAGLEAGNCFGIVWEADFLRILCVWRLGIVWDCLGGSFASYFVGLEACELFGNCWGG